MTTEPQIDPAPSAGSPPPAQDQLSGWDVGLLIYRQGQDQLFPDVFPLGYIQATPSNPTPSLKSPSLRLVPGETTAHIILVERPARTRLATVGFEITREPFHIFLRLTEDNLAVVSHDDRAEQLLYDLELDDPLAIYQPVQLKEEIATSDLTFLIDGTMSQAELSLAVDFAASVARRLKDQMPLRFGCVVYGEYKTYPHPPGRKRRIPFEVNIRGLGAYHHFERFLTRAATPSDGFADQDLSDALELGLREAGKLDWQALARHLVIIGNSPPHPAADERADYRLLDFTTGEFRGIDWRMEVEGLKESGRLHLYSYLIEPAISPDEEQKDYLHDVWAALDDEHPVLPNTLTVGSLQESAERLTEMIWEHQQHIRRPVAPAHLPLLAGG